MKSLADDAAAFVIDFDVQHSFRFDFVFFETFAMRADLFSFASTKATILGPAPLNATPNRPGIRGNASASASPGNE